MVILEDVTEYLTSENLTETANDLSKVLPNIQSTWLSRKVKPQTFSNESIVVPVSITLLWHVPLVPVLTGFHCNVYFSHLLRKARFVRTNNIDVLYTFIVEY